MSVTITSDKFDTEAQLVEALQRIDADADITAQYKHDDWEFGSPCPECGNTSLSSLIPFEEINHSEHGDFRYRGEGDYVGPTMSVMCLECDETLYTDPPTNI